MVLRNRLVAVLIRILLAVFYIYPLNGYLSEFPSYGVALSTFSVLLGIVLIVVTVLEIIFNLIDLRHGVHGVPAGPYMPIALPVYAFSVLSGILYFAAQIPVGSAPFSTFGVFFHVMMIVGPLIDWIALDEKGTVRFAAGFTSQLYPILYFIFGYFRTLIWDESPIYGTHMYAYAFLDFTNPNIVWNAILFFAMTLGIVSLTIFSNNLFAGKYGLIRQRAD
ncbi:MAG: hypothetical protein K6E59_00700 [Bacilli bacterium]|nr:hypothetical protein [Bacilli bacterium]